MIAMAPVNNNKQIFELLDNTDSQSGSEMQQLVIPPRKKRFRRRLRNNPSIRHEEGDHDCRCTTRTVSWSIFCLVLVCWLISLTCLAAVLRRDIYRLDGDLQSSDKVKRMEGVPAVSVPLRAGKKMKKRKELDALVAHTVSKRSSTHTSGISSHEQLLTDSSDEWTPAGGAAARCRRRVAARRRVCSAIFRACSVLLIFTCTVGTTTVMWLFIDVRQQVTSLRTELNQVVAAHKGVPEALQNCHSLSKELHKNQSDITNKLAGFSLLLGNFTANLSEIQTALSAVEQQLKASPSLVNDPRLVKYLSESVAKLGSKIQDLETTTNNIKDQDSRQDNVLSGLLSNVTNLSAQVANLAGDRAGVSASQLATEKDAIMNTVNQLVANVTLLNDTLIHKIQWTADDQIRDHKTVESLQEMNQNVTARLQTLEGLCSKSTTTPVLTLSIPNDSAATVLKQDPTPGVFSHEKTVDTPVVVPTLGP